MITVDGLTFAYPKEPAPAIRDLTFSVAEGEGERVGVRGLVWAG